MSLSPRVRWVVDAVSKVTLSVPVDALEPVDDRLVDVGLLGDLARACQLRRRLEFCYTKQDGQTVVRRADPRSLVNTVRRWYLVAFDIDAGEWRTYRVDRVSEVQVMDFPARSHEFPGRNVEEWVTGQLAAGWQQVTATVRVHAPREAVSRWVAPAWGVVEEESPGVTIVRAGADTYESIARWLLLVQSDIDVIEPDELRVAFRRVARQADRAGRE
ncbi:helix-turn-helix transcriptional regulator [Rathayibacter iranicus]|uniref:helix-turn-helix transcriptional regulator n=1 Tax=Rathayibacter iranicus TaxID=59737 RepID=UPI00132B0806|nr:WYL domain-containing protein [Rathayibacter iranicus]MWV29544.1 WYL domain-containing protein [Rathayibacter iranicus NCPPB 2253 = VKM Ac-1602]